MREGEMRAGEGVEQEEREVGEGWNFTVYLDGWTSPSGLGRTPFCVVWMEGGRVGVIPCMEYST